MPIQNITTQAITDYSLNKNRIDLWYFSLRDPLPAQIQVLNEEETARANRFYFERHRRRFAIAHSYLRLILSRYTAIAPADIQFQHNNHGKPSIIHEAKLEFNLSHSGEWAILAIGCEYPVGVDIEIYSARPWIDLAKSMFSPAEINRIQTCPRARLPALFFSIWAQKEAFIKALGLGLSYPTREMTTPIDPEQPILDPVHHQLWHSKPFMPQTTMAGALCYHPAVQELRYNPLANPADLIALCPN